MMDLRRVVLHVSALVALSWNASAQTEIRIQDCGFVVEALRVPLTEGFHARYEDIVLSWGEAIPATLFTSLFAGDVDFVVASRRMRADETEMASRLGLDVRELVLGLDGIAVVVHPSNKVEKLTLEQLEMFYRGGMASWLGVGGTDAPVRLVSAAEGSGIQILFKELVVGGTDTDTTFKPDTDYLSSTTEILERVASEPGAIGFVSMSADRSRVRSVPIADGEAGAVLPSVASVSNATYPLRYPVHLYTLGEPEPEGVRRRFLRYLYLHEGAALVADAGLVPIQSFGLAYRSPDTSAHARVSRTRIGFGFRGSRLDAQARQDLLAVASRLTAGDEGVWITGHAEPTEARDELALARARTVADFLEQQNVDASRIRLDSRGVSEPMASNAELDGRRQNRRAEVWILPN